MVPTANPVDSIAYLRGPLILKTCVILKTAIYVLLACTGGAYNGRLPALPFPSVFRSQIKTRQNTKYEQSGQAQGTLFIMAANKKVKAAVKVSSLSAHAAGPLVWLVLACFGSLSCSDLRSDLRFCTL
jgi:hypothetical protein